MKAFLSHSSVDKKLVTKVHDILGKNKAWLDAVQIDVGERIPDKINKGLEEATHFILFWSTNSKNSNWVKAELNAGFVKTMADKCKFMIFVLDDTPLPSLYESYKYSKIDTSDLDKAAENICNIILGSTSSVVNRSSFVNRTKEIGDIESALNQGAKLIIIHGILGIGKFSLAKKANEWLFSNQIKPLIIDFNKVHGLTELAITMSTYLKNEIPEVYFDKKAVKSDIQLLFEIASSQKRQIILRDVKSWLLDSSEPNEDLAFLINIILESEMFINMPVIITSTRYIKPCFSWNVNDFMQLKLKGMKDEHIASIIKNNLFLSFEEYSYEKTVNFAKKLYGYPLAAKLAAYHISNDGYDYYLQQDSNMTALKVGLAKQLISYSKPTEECVKYLKLLALSQSSLYNSEYLEVFEGYTAEQISAVSDEAFWLGLVYFDNGSYKLEHIVEDYYYDLAFNDPIKPIILNKLEKYLKERINTIKYTEPDNYLRLLPITLHILMLNFKINDVFEIRSDMSNTMKATMWDLYNHRNYDGALNIANALIDNGNEDSVNEAKYVSALCNIRTEAFVQATKIINELIASEGETARYNYALGRIAKYQGHFEKALILFEKALHLNPRHMSSLRESAECYCYLDDTTNAIARIKQAKQIDDSNVYISLLECRILAKSGKAEEALKLIDSQSLLVDDPSQIYFRRGRIYDEMNNQPLAIECYKKAIEYNNLDARLCLLNHTISTDENAATEIESLNKILKGKRKFILLNIKARYIGYYGHQEDEAIKLLDDVADMYRDRQWYAVKLQLLKKIKVDHQENGRKQMASLYERKIQELNTSFSCKFTDDISDIRLLLPDA